MTRLAARRAVVVILVIVAATACSDDSDSTTAPQTTTTVAPSATAAEACARVDAQVVAGALGQDVNKIEANSEGKGFVECAFVGIDPAKAATNSNAVIRLRVAEDNVSAEYERRLRTLGASQQVDGVGAAAAWGPTADGGVLVARDDDLEVEVSVFKVEPDRAKSVAVAVATRAFAPPS